MLKRTRILIGPYSGSTTTSFAIHPPSFINFLVLLTPLYQSDQWWAGGLRDLVFPWMYQTLFSKRNGNHNFRLKTGPFQQLDYDQVAQLPKENSVLI